ncbi:MAG: FtsW/RodA/SpoVE family cell cycle protein [Prevotellaceae bacterium]|jgi:cell division protein FtsW|nr:FtsW/RodA/SpoVE family cell cycle protein [Prevotellaceae bacterium]
MQQNKNRTTGIKLEGDRQIWRLLFILALFSILAVSSSSYKLTLYKGNFSFIFSHVMYLFAGFVIMYVLHKTSLDTVKKLAPVALLFIALLLLFVLIFSPNKRWMLGAQPSEFAKIAIVVYLAKTLSEKIKTGIEFIILVVLPVGIYCGLILFGHTSTVLIIGLNAVVLVLMAANRKHIAVTFMSVLFAAAVYMAFESFFPRSDTAKSRISTFFERVEPKSGSQEYYAVQAINRGGVIALRPGKSKYREKLSEANNDFIYAIIVEEYGLFGGIIFVVLPYLYLFYRVIRIIKRCKKPFPALMTGGLFFMIIVQTLINIGVSVHVLPVTGQNLPLISSGGSSIIATCIAFGLILSVSRLVETQKKQLRIKNQEAVIKKRN